MLNRKGLLSVLLTACLLLMATAHADSLKDFVLSKLDGQGTVDSINTDSSQIVIDDSAYTLSANVTVFDVVNRKNSSIDNVRQGDTVGFKARPLSKPTAPFDQLIVKIWILPGQN